jgi:hypothetical protein
LSPKVVFDFQLGQSSCDIKDLLVRQLADFACGMDVEAGQKAGRGVAADAEEGLE